MDLFIQQQRESVANDSMSLQSDEEVVREATDDAVRYNTAQQEHNSVLENRGGELMNGDVVNQVNIKEATNLFVQKAAAPKNRVEFSQGSIGTIKSSLATSYDVWRPPWS